MERAGTSGGAGSGGAGGLLARSGGSGAARLVAGLTAGEVQRSLSPALTRGAPEASPPARTEALLAAWREEAGAEAARRRELAALGLDR